VVPILTLPATYRSPGVGATPAKALPMVRPSRIAAVPSTASKAEGDDVPIPTLPEGR